MVVVFVVDYVVVVQVQVVGYIGIDWCQVMVGKVQWFVVVGLGDFQVVFLEQVGGVMGIVEIKFVQQYQVWVYLLQYGGDFVCVFVVVFQFFDQVIGVVGVQ